MKKNRLVIMGIMVIASLIISCSDTLMIPETGSLIVHLVERSTRDIPQYTPSVSMENATFSIHLTGPDGTHIEALSITESSKEFSELQVGIWEITINGYNDEGRHISQASFQTVIRKNQITTETARLTPVSGIGSISFALEWEDPSAYFSDPQVVLTFQPASDLDATTNEAITIVDMTHASSVIQLVNGWYLVTASLYEGAPSEAGNLPWWQTTFSLRIVEQETTTVSISVPFEDISLQGTGASSIYIQEDMKQPFSVSFARPSETCVEGDTITLATTTSHSSNALYRWYVNGVRQLGMDAHTMSYQFLTQGRYHISLFVIDNAIISGYQEIFVVSPPVYVEQLSIDQGDSLSGATGTDVQLSATLSPSNATNQTIRWESNDTNIAEVDQEGLVTLKREGTAVITAFAEGGIGVSDSITIYSQFLKVGDTGQGGGTIFYVDSADEYPGWTYLEFAQHDTYPELPWGRDNLWVSETYPSVGRGPHNTNRIIQYFGRNYNDFLGNTNYAAKYCDEFSRNGYEDWFLPSKDEALLLADNAYSLGLWGLGNGGGTPVWTSVSDGYDNAIMVYLGGKDTYSWHRGNSNLVIPIRRY